MIMIDYFNRFDQAIGAYAGVDMASYIVAIIILILFFVLAQIANFVFNKVFLIFTSKTKTNVDDDIVKILNTPIFYTVVIFGMHQSFSYIGILSKYSDDFSRIIKSLIIIIWMRALAKLVTIIISELGFKFAARTKSSLDDELMPLFKKLSSIVIYFSGIMILLQMWNLDITPLLASAGIAGFVVAFAAQDTISHLFGGVSIYFDKPFRVGDRIQLESGETGDVLEIGIRSTRIKTFDETVVIVPNNKIASSKIINYNQPDQKSKAKVNVKVCYGSDIDQVRKILLEIAESTEGVRKDPSPSALFTGLGEYALEFLVVAWVDSPNKQFSVRTKISEAIYKRFQKEGIKIPYPTQEVCIKN